MTKNTDTDANEMMIRNKKAATESDMKTEEKDRQTVTVTVTKAVTVMTTETDVKTEKIMSSEFRKNIRLLAATQMMLKVLLISQMSLLCFHAD